MLPTDLKTLQDRLEELAEVFERKVVSKKALGVWFDVLKEFPVEAVADVLIGWPKIHPKFPAPSDVWKIVSERCTVEREKRASEENRREFHPGVGGAQAEAFLKKMRETLNLPAWTPRQHWERVLAQAKPGSIGQRYAKEALKKMGAVSIEREPGEDDEQKAVNF